MKVVLSPCSAHRRLASRAQPIAPPETAERAVRDAAALLVVHVDTALVLKAISESRRSRLSFWDALIVSAAGAAGCQMLLTEDLNHGQIIGGVHVENPFL